MTKPLEHYSEHDIRIMALTIFGEARGLDIEGQTKVAWVIRNRAERNNLPFFAGGMLGKQGAITRVCTAPWQFSCWNETDPNRIHLDALYREWLDDKIPVGLEGTVAITTAVLEGIVDDITNGADHYHTIAKPGWAPEWPPAWAKDYGEVSRDPGRGGHVFYSSLVRKPRQKSV